MDVALPSGKPVLRSLRAGKQPLSRVNGNADQLQAGKGAGLTDGGGDGVLAKEEGALQGAHPKR